VNVTWLLASFAIGEQRGRVFQPAPSSSLGRGESLGIPDSGVGAEPEQQLRDVDRGALIVRQCEERWRSGGRRALVAGSTSGFVHAVDPDHDGAVLWEQRVGKGSRLGGVHWGLASDSRYVYAENSDALVIPVADGTAGAQKTLLPFGSLLLSGASGGGLFALAVDTGRIAWHTPHPGCGGGRPGCSPAQSAAITVIPGVVFSGGLDGHLRAYDTESGRIIWDVDTVMTYQTVNGVTARGGALDGPGPVIAGGMLLVNSGYAFVGSMPGNVLLAFSVEGK